MFRIGEFAQIARVSGRLLRYYDNIGLLRPGRTDAQTGYRLPQRSPQNKGRLPEWVSTGAS